MLFPLLINLTLPSFSQTHIESRYYYEYYLPGYPAYPGDYPLPGGPIYPSYPDYDGSSYTAFAIAGGVIVFVILLVVVFLVVCGVLYWRLPSARPVLTLGVLRF